MKTIEQRLLQLGIDPLDAFCPKALPFRKILIEEDTYNQDPADKSHKFQVSGYTHYIDLMSFYAAIRKGKGKKESYKLDDILLNEIGESKFEYEGTIQDAALINFEKFLLYSMFDSYRLYQLECKNKDIDLMYNMSLITLTRLDKVLKKTVSLRNLASTMLWEAGYCLSNNFNQHISYGEKEKFRGA